MLATALGTVPAIVNGKLTPLSRYLEGPIRKTTYFSASHSGSLRTKSPLKKIRLTFVTDIEDHTVLFNSRSSPSDTWLQV